MLHHFKLGCTYKPRENTLSAQGPLSNGAVQIRSLLTDYGGRGVNGYMLDCESGVAGSIPVDHPILMPP